MHLDDYGDGAIEAHLELKVSACMVDGVDHQLMGDEQDRLGVGDALLVQLGDGRADPADAPQRTHARMVDLKVRMSCRDGTYRWIRWNSRSSARAKHDDDGTAERIRGITIEVTDRPGVRTVGYLGRVRGAGGVGSTGSAPEPHRHVLLGNCCTLHRIRRYLCG